MNFPVTRHRRLRATESIRNMVRETSLAASDLVYPLFVTSGHSSKSPIDAMPGCFQLSQDLLLEEVRSAYTLGIPAVLLFGIPPTKDAAGSQAWASDGVVQGAVRLLKAELPNVVVITDVCLCEYTDHGHCGAIKNGTVDNDATLELLALTALSHAQAGADIVAPSDMMDGRVSAIRENLDNQGCQQTAIMSYAAKYASAFYGPFRAAADSAPQFGDRYTYQMDPANRREAAREVISDIEEGADYIMVKPALGYLDIVSDARALTDLPIAAYNVSGEYSMVKAAAINGWIDERRTVLEVLTSIKRAGADLIITYHAKDAAEWLTQK